MFVFQQLGPFFKKHRDQKRAKGSQGVKTNLLFIKKVILLAAPPPHIQTHTHAHTHLLIIRRPPLFTKGREIEKRVERGGEGMSRRVFDSALFGVSQKRTGDPRAFQFRQSCPDEMATILLLTL